MHGMLIQIGKPFEDFLTYNKSKISEIHKNLYEKNQQKKNQQKNLAKF